ncbi:MAG: hypothetical protein M9941_07425 [Anaerolineae bacterium]|nr:hypothetical protein [Anaerolineae bacterium]
MNNKSFFVQWVIAVTITMMVATMGAFLAMWTISEAVTQLAGEAVGTLVAGALFGGLLGLGAGVGQAFVLRSQGIAFGRWVIRTALAGAVSMGLGFALMFALFDTETMPEVVTAVLIALFLALPIGIVQMQMLKPHVAQPALWVVVCLLAFLVALGIGFSLDGEGREWLLIGVVGVLFAVISGAGMVWLAQRADPAIAA